MNPKLKENIQESLSAVLPITGIVLLSSVLLFPMEIGTVVMFLAGACLLVIGMGFFQLGAEMAMTPLGEGIGAQMTAKKRKWPALVLGFLMGVLITVAEPDLQVLARQVPSIPDLTLILAVAAGVGAFLSVAILRIIDKIRLSNLLLAFYGILLALSLFTPKNFIAVAYDSGGVTTGPITVPFIMAVGAGLTSVRGDKHASVDSFGLVALSSIGPVLAVMLLGLFFRPASAAYQMAEPIAVRTMRDVAKAFAFEIPTYLLETALSILPIAAVFAIFQLVSRRYTRRQAGRCLMGLLYTYVGLVLFLCGVNVGFAPVGAELGRQLAASRANWLLIPMGMLIGYFIVKAEPAIQVLNRQVHAVTDGMISERAMNLCLSLGVSVSVGLSMLRVLTHLPIGWIVIPGYVAALALSRVVPKIFVGIAFDSGGVASGPMTTTFLLPLSIGACEVLGGSVMTDAFGVVAMVALTPLIAVQLMGLAYMARLRKAESLAPAKNRLPEDADEIIELEEEWCM